MGINYTTFGSPLPGRTANANSFRYGFNGNENDDETGTIDFGMRNYSPRLGRFLSMDPDMEKYPSWTPYLFAANIPTRFIDVFGRGPGDKFASMDAAARDFALTYNDNSIADGAEYATTIMKVTTATEVYYTYVQPSVGDAASSTPSTRGLAAVGDNTIEYVATAHTHGEYLPQYKNNVFSQQDIQSAEDDNLVDYIATPSGTLQKYDPATNQTTTLANDIPSDPKDPQRVNTVDYENLPKDEPTYGAWEWIKHNILVPIGQGAEGSQNKEEIEPNAEASPQDSASPQGPAPPQDDDTSCN